MNMVIFSYILNSGSLEGNTIKYNKPVQGTLWSFIKTVNKISLLTH